MGSGRRPGVRIDVCLLPLHRSGGEKCCGFVAVRMVDDGGDLELAGVRPGRLSFV